MSSTPVSAETTGLSLRQSVWVRLKPSDLGILPLIAACPFMYFPELLEGDTQPWVLLAALIGFFTYRTRRFILRSDFPLVLLALLCVVVFALRGGSGPDLLRAAYTQITFIVLWLVCRGMGVKSFQRPFA